MEEEEEEGGDSGCGGVTQWHLSPGVQGQSCACRKLCQINPTASKKQRNEPGLILIHQYSAVDSAGQLGIYTGIRKNQD